MTREDAGRNNPNGCDPLAAHNMTISEVMQLGDVCYQLVFVTYHVGNGGHFVGQGYFADSNTKYRIGRWYKYNDLEHNGFAPFNSGDTISAHGFDHKWHDKQKTIATYVRTDVNAGEGIPSTSATPLAAAHAWRIGDPTLLLTKHAKLAVNRNRADKGMKREVIEIE
jgi:hypothetical protein